MRQAYLSKSKSLDFSMQSISNWYVALLALCGWWSNTLAEERLPPLPNCDATKAPAGRAVVLDHYLTALEDWTEKTPDFMVRSAAGTYVTLVAAHLLPENTPFRRYEQECWMYFEDARRALSQGKMRNTKQSVRAWHTCLAMRQDDLLAASKSFQRCLR